MSQITPILSLVIPTRNRVDYVKSSIRSALAIPSVGLQLIVEDNSDSILLETWIRDTVVDERVVYNYSATPISMVENYDRAMSRASGEYVCLIGDDDGVNPEIVDAVRWAKAEQLDALAPTTPAHYVWPDLHLRSAAAVGAGELRISSFTGQVSFPDPETEMRKCARDAGQSFHALPKAYYGIVKRECLQRVRERTGTYFPGPSPDMAVALAVANYVKRICRIDYPLFLPGSSARSNAGISGMGKHIGRLRDQPHLPATCERDWLDVVPSFYSVETMWAESVVSALRSTGRTDILTDFNVPRLYADCTMWHPEYYKMIARGFYPALRATKRGAVRGTLQFAGRFSYLTWLRLRSLVSRFVRRTPSQTSEYSAKGLRDIGEAVQALVEHLKSTGKRFDENVM